MSFEEQIIGAGLGDGSCIGSLPDSYDRSDDEPEVEVSKKPVESTPNQSTDSQANQS